MSSQSPAPAPTGLGIVKSLSRFTLGVCKKKPREDVVQNSKYTMIIEKNRPHDFRVDSETEEGREWRLRKYLIKQLDSAGARVILRNNTALDIVKR